MTNIEEKALNAAVQAYYESTVARAQTIISKTNFHIGELPEIMMKISAESETAQILIFSSYFESKIEQLLGYQLRNDTARGDNKDIFGSFGPLATFSSRVALAYQLRWLEKSAKTKLDTFRKLRNEFAHNAYKVSYEDDKIKSWFALLEGRLPDLIEKVGPIMREQSGKDILEIPRISVRSRYLCSLVVLMHDVCMQLLVFPICVQMEINPSDVTKTSTAPQLIKDVTGAMIDAIYVLIGKNQRSAATELVPSSVAAASFDRVRRTRLS